MKDPKTKQAFIDFLQDPENKDLRFWQAIRTFSKYDFIYGEYAGETEDTFYIESDSEKDKRKVDK